MKEFIKKYFFYRVPKTEKQFIRQRLIADDHRIYNGFLCVIIFLQSLMLVRSLFKDGFGNADKPWVHQYRWLYIALIVFSLLELFLTTTFARKKKDFLYFTVVSVSMFILQFWAVGITVLDSYNNIDLTTFAYTTTLLPVFLVLEPWIMASNLATGAIALDLFLVLYPATAQNFGSREIIHTLSILALSVISGTFNFYRRVKKLKIEIENEKLTQILTRQTEIDDLTQLYNRRYLTNRLNEPLRIGNRPTGIVMMDVDYFKTINDRFGHVSGDKVLSAIGSTVLSFIGNDGYAVRYGGEEFLIYFYHVTGNELKAKATDLKRILDHQPVVAEDGSEISFTVSMGLAIATPKLSFSGIISLADNALYKAKETRDCIVQDNF